MIKFDLQKFLIDQRLSIQELADIIGATKVGVWRMKERGNINIVYLRKIEKHYGDCSGYIKETQVA